MRGAECRRNATNHRERPTVPLEDLEGLEPVGIMLLLEFLAAGLVFSTSFPSLSHGIPHRAMMSPSDKEMMRGT